MLCLPAAKFCVGPENTDNSDMHPARKGAIAADFLISIAVLAVGILSMTVAPFPVTLSPAVQLAIVVGGGAMLLSTVLNSLAEAREQSSEDYCFGDT